MTKGAREEGGGRIKEPMELAGKKILVIGLGKTGLATARFLAGRDVEIVKKDYKVAVSTKEGFVDRNVVGDDLFTLKRIPAANNLNDFIFRLVKPSS